MPEDVAKHFALPNFSTTVPGMLREVLDNDTTPRDKNSFNVLGMSKDNSGGAHMILKTVMKVDQGYTVFNYGPPRP